MEVSHAHKLLKDIPNKVRDILGIMVAVRLVEQDSKALLEIGVDAYPCPVNYKSEYYCRIGSTLQILKGAALDRFLLRKYGRTWDGSPLPGLESDDLDGSVFNQFRKLAQKSKRLPEAVLLEDDRHLLEKLHLVNGDYLTHAAALLFYAEAERFIGGAYVKIGYFENDADLRYQDEVPGCSIPMQISVYPDKLMIWNPGELPPNWTVEKLLDKHASQPFNPDVANVFFGLV